MQHIPLSLAIFFLILMAVQMYRRSWANAPAPQHPFQTNIAQQWVKEHTTMYNNISATDVNNVLAQANTIYTRNHAPLTEAQKADVQAAILEALGLKAGTAGYPATPTVDPAKARQRLLGNVLFTLQLDVVDGNGTEIDTIEIQKELNEEAWAGKDPQVHTAAIVEELKRQLLAAFTASLGELQTDYLAIVREVR